MKKIIMLLILLIAVSAHANRKAYVVNGSAETLSLIDLDEGTVQNHIVTLGETPNQIVYYDNYLYVVNSISANIMKIDTASNQIASTINLPEGSNPYNIAFGGNYGYVSGLISGKVYKINLSNNLVEGELEIGYFPEGIFYHNGYIYATRIHFNPDDWSYGQGDIVVIDAVNLELNSVHNIGTNPQYITKASDNTLQIVCTGNYADIEGSIYVFDLNSQSVIDSVLIGGEPSCVAISQTNIGYVSAGGWGDNGFVLTYNTNTREVLNGNSDPILTGVGVVYIAVDSTGYAYSCNFMDATISKINLAGEIENTFYVGDGPTSIVILDSLSSNIYADEIEIPQKMGLLSNYPNPFNAGTIIKLEVITDNFNSEGELRIFDISGKLVRALNIETSGSTNEVYWDGSDNNGNICSSGVYFVKLCGQLTVNCNLNYANTLKITMIK